MVFVDKNAIKSFAIESRRQMIESVKYQASLIGITAEGISDPISKAEGMETYDYCAGTHTIYDRDIQKRESLVKEINNKGFDSVVEEVAYTWFNRIIAIRFMEVNDYLPTRTRVLSSEIEGKLEPDIITEALDIDLDYANEDKELILKLKDENKLDDLFQFLFVKQCNKLNEILPCLFEKTDDYMELLLAISFIDESGIVRQLIDTISEEDFTNQVEIIGWLYQFYNTELKDETFANLKKGKKISKDRIPAATQLFTPDWIVMYMVENSVGRLWLEGHPNDDLKSKWEYYVEEAEQETEVEQQLITIRKEYEILKPEDITVIDPCMGSGHILAYVFEVLMDIYVSEGYTEKDACESILKNNLYGLDIDKRAYQLAYFAVLMKARKYNRRILTKNISPLLCSIEETNSISEKFIEELVSQDRTCEKDIKYIYSSFKDAKEYGSILNINVLDFNKLNELISNFELNNSNLNKFKYHNEIQIFKNILDQSKLLYRTYDIVITNPPYMGNSGMNSHLKDYLKSNFKNTKNDLSTVFMERSFNFAKEYGFISMINIPVWMFISSYENLRIKIIEEKTFINMLHLGRGIFGSDFGTTTFIIKNNSIKGYKSTFKQLYEDRNAVDSVEKKEQMFFNDKNNYCIKQENFDKLPGSLIAYWADNNLINSFKENNELQQHCSVKQGLITGNTKRFLKYWFEIDFTNFELNMESIEDINKSKCKWFPYNKGGDYRKWYGNQEYVINWENNGYEIKNYKNNNGKLRSRPQNLQYSFSKSLSWSAVTNNKISFRFFPNGFLFDVAGSSVFTDEDKMWYILGFLNSQITQEFLNIISPTINYSAGYIGLLPFILIEDNVLISSLVRENVLICKKDWDDYELSWNFKIHPLIDFKSNSLKDNFIQWDITKKSQFEKLKKNEIKLDTLFSEIYGIKINGTIEEKFISIRLADYEGDIKSFVSYVVGCIFGRYSLDDEGLQFAGGAFDLSNYSKFIPDNDNIIPVLDTEYFDDDIVGRFVEFVKVCFGEETLEENLDFIAGALNKKGKTSREIIRNYFLTDFFKDHAKMYKKCPIYWQFDSGKQNAFKCLIYMHRYDSSIVARVRTDYLHKTQKAIEQNLSRCENIISNSSNKSEISKATKDKSKYIKQLDEIKVYDEALRHMANQNIEIDLDDGVKVNYAKFQNIEISKEGEKTKKINLLKKV